MEDEVKDKELKKLLVIWDKNHWPTVQETRAIFPRGWQKAYNNIRELGEPKIENE